MFFISQDLNSIPNALGFLNLHHINKLNFLFPWSIPNKFGSIWLSNFVEESEENVNKLRTTQGRQRMPRDPYCWLGSLPGDKKAACNYVWPSIDINLLYLIILHSHIIILAKWSIINWPLNSMITQLYSKNCRT